MNNLFSFDYSVDKYTWRFLTCSCNFPGPLLVSTVQDAHMRYTELYCLLIWVILSDYLSYIVCLSEIFISAHMSYTVCFSPWNKPLCNMLRDIVSFSLAIFFVTILLVYLFHSSEKSIYPSHSSEKNIAKQDSPPDSNRTQGRVKILLVAYGRTGSSLTGELLSLEETTAYFFEPFYKWVFLWGLQMF